MKEDHRYNRWLRENEYLPPRCRTWIQNSSGEYYPVHSRAEGRRLVAEWNKGAHSDRDVYVLWCVDPSRRGT